MKEMIKIILYIYKNYICLYKIYLKIKYILYVIYIYI